MVILIKVFFILLYSTFANVFGKGGIMAEIHAKV